MLQVSVAQKLFFVQLLIYSLFLETAIQLFLQAFANGLKKHMIKLEFWITFFIFLMNEYSGFSFELNIESYENMNIQNISATARRAGIFHRWKNFFFFNLVLFCLT